MAVQLAVELVTSTVAPARTSKGVRNTTMNVRKPAESGERSRLGIGLGDLAGAVPWLNIILARYFGRRSAAFSILGKQRSRFLKYDRFAP
jgi:hypothetical protein